MKRKRTAALTAKIKARRAAGATLEDLKREFGLGLATIHEALKTKASEPSNPSPPATEKGAKPEHVPTREELLRYLSEQARALRADAAAAKDASTRAAANRNLISVQALITKLVPPVAEPAGVYVSNEEMEQAAKTGEERIFKHIDFMISEAKKWPHCTTCGQPIAPQDWKS
jgi:hypothetical protein